MTVSSKEVPRATTVSDKGVACNIALTEQALQQIERLADSLFLRKNALHRRSVLMVDLGGNTSSLWVATGVASVLGKAINSMVHVLTVGTDVSQIQWNSADVKSSPLAGSCVLECFEDRTLEAARVLSSRLSAIIAEGLTAILHLSQSKEQTLAIPRIERVDGALLLVRAAQTRRAVLESLERRLALAGMPVLGSVLLDRDLPIPEKLYRLL
jgi:hypothetical protein